MSEHSVKATQTSFSLNALSSAVALCEAIEANDVGEIERRRATLREELDHLSTAVAYPNSQKAIQTARENNTDDDLGIDDNPIVSCGEDGTWVQAWLYVRNDETDDDTNEEETAGD